MSTYEVESSLRLSSPAVVRSHDAWRVRWSNAAYGLAMRVLFRPTLTPQAMRANFERWAGTCSKQLARKFPGARFATLQVGSLGCELLSAHPQTERSLLYLHGGGYVFGSISTYRRRALKLSYRCHADVLIPEYRLAPEHPFPAAFEDAYAAWLALTEQRPASRCFIAGDSAGGGLALALAAHLVRERAPLPAGVIALSPWTDLTLSGASYARNARSDCWVTRAQLAEWRDMYCGAQRPNDPRISPLYAALAGMPPLLLLAGEREVLLDDARAVACKARQAGVEVIEHVGAGMQHDWPLTVPWLPQSAAAWREIETFVERLISG